MNKPILDQYKQLLQDMKSQQQLFDQFDDEEVQMPAEYDRLFYNFSCYDIPKYIPTASITPCLDSAKGETSVSLLQLMAQSSYEGEKLYNRLADNKPWNSTFLHALFAEGATIFRPVFTVMGNLLTILNIVATEEYNSQADWLRKQGVIWAVMAGFLVCIVLIGTLRFAIRKILDKQMERKRLLSLIPPTSIAANRFLRQYLIDHSNGYLDNIKHLL